jgi:hypothetical protein
MRALMLCCLFVLSGCAQVSYDEAPADAFVHRAMIFVPGADKSELYHRVMVYLAKTYHTSSEVIQYASLEHGRIIGRGSMGVDAFNGLSTETYHYTYSIDIEIVNGKIRAYFSDFRRGWYTPGREFEAASIKVKVATMIKDMNAAIKATPALLIPD